MSTKQGSCPDMPCEKRQRGSVRAHAFPGASPLQPDLLGALQIGEKHRLRLCPKIWILDHNYNLWGRAICELEVPSLRALCDGVAWHTYVGTHEMMS